MCHVIFSYTQRILAREATKFGYTAVALNWLFDFWPSSIPSFRIFLEVLINDFQSASERRRGDTKNVGSTRTNKILLGALQKRFESRFALFKHWYLVGVVNE